MKVYSFEEIKDKYLGKKGTSKRDRYEFELRMDIISDVIKKMRKQQNLTQEQLGKLVGVQKAQICKLENGEGNATLATLIKVFTALSSSMEIRLVSTKKRKRAA